MYIFNYNIKLARIKIFLGCKGVRHKIREARIFQWMHDNGIGV